MAWYMIENDELYHYGVKGQKWGIRRYQNEDGTLTRAGKKHRDQLEKHSDDIVIKSGSTRSSVTVNENMKLRKKPVLGFESTTRTYVYNDKDEHDRLIYEGAFSTYIQGRYWCAENPIFKMDYKTVGDLVSPSEKRRVDLFVESFREKPDNYLDALNFARGNWQAFADAYGEESISADKRKMISKTITKDSSDADLREVGYRQFNTASEYKTTPYRVAQDTYYKKLKKEGYNALIDDNNYKVYNNAHNPLIVLDANKRLKRIRTTRLSPDDINRNTWKLRKKQGGRVTF